MEIFTSRALESMIRSNLLQPSLAPSTVVVILEEHGGQGYEAVADLVLTVFEISVRAP